jgi:hypothetical protein
MSGEGGTLCCLISNAISSRLRFCCGMDLSFFCSGGSCAVNAIVSGPSLSVVGA